MKKLDGALYIDAKQRKKKRLCTTTLLQVRKMNVTKQILPFGFCFCFSQVLVKTSQRISIDNVLLGERFKVRKVSNFFFQGDTVKRAKILPHKVVKLYRPDTLIQWGRGRVGARTYPSPPQTHTTQTYVKFGDFAEQHLSLVSNKSHLK